MLEAVVGADVDVESAVSELIRQGLVYELSGYPEVEFAFRYDVLRRALYEKIPSDRKEALTQRVRERLGQHHEARPGEAHKTTTASHPSQGFPLAALE